jgi:sec-independent protein translocase protein TatA
MEIGLPELIVILLIVILIFGPGRIMKLGRDLGDGVRLFRKGIQSAEDPLESGQEQEGAEGANPGGSKTHPSK